MREVALEHIEGQRVGMFGGFGRENEARLRVDEPADEPRGRSAVDVRARAREPCATTVAPDIERPGCGLRVPAAVAGEFVLHFHPERRGEEINAAHVLELSGELFEFGGFENAAFSFALARSAQRGEQRGVILRAGFVEKMNDLGVLHALDLAHTQDGRIGTVGARLLDEPLEPFVVLRCVGKQIGRAFERDGTRAAQLPPQAQARSGAARWELVEKEEPAGHVAFLVKYIFRLVRAFSRDERVLEGETIRRFYELKLYPERMPRFPAALTLRHTIEPGRVLWGKNAESLEKSDAFFLASVTSVETVMAALRPEPARL